MSRLDESEVYKWFDILKNNNELVEIRLIGTNKNGSGYFTDAKTIIEAIKPYTDSYNCYFTLNSINPACYGREQKDKIVLRPKNTTQDSEIISRNYVLIDLDPKRPSGVCSTREESMRAYEKGKEVTKFLMDNGFYEPLVVFSSSGIHLYIKCALINNEENTKLVKRFLNAISMLFSDDDVDCDCSVYNAARISRLIGSYSCKGANNDATRPQRKCRFLSIPDEVKVNEREYFEKIAALYPDEEERPSRENNYSVERFDLEAFLQKHNIEVTKVEQVAGGKKYVLKHCIFNHSHTGKDAVIFQRDSGQIAYHCFHSSCQQYTWRDVRITFEPNAYDRKDINEYNFKRRYYGAYLPEPFEPKKETDDLGKKWLKFSDIKKFDSNDVVSIPTGILAIDRKIGGLNLGECSILSGINGSGKSVWLNQLMVNAVQRGFKVSVWSGELSAEWLKMWVMQCAAGKNNVVKVPNTEHAYYVSGNVYSKIEAWLDGKLFIYNNNYGSRFEQLVADIGEVVDREKINLVVVDNCMAVDLDARGGDKLEKQKYFILTLVEMARKKNIHIVVVCHPRKEVGNGLIRKESISGSGDLTNAVQNCFLMHRCSEDFFKRASDFWGKKRVEELMVYDNVIEICKSRSTGVVDFIAGMYYEEETKRYKNTIAENIVYGWCETPPAYVEQQLPDENNEADENPFPLVEEEPPF